MIEGTIGSWLVKEGAMIQKGDVIMEYENEKNVIEYEALEGGIIHIIAQEGDTYPVGEVIAVLAETQEAYSALVNGSSAPAAETKGTAAVEAKRAETLESVDSSKAAPQTLNNDGHVRASGLARKLAMDAGVNLNDILKTKDSPFARIMAADVTEYIESLKTGGAKITSADENTITEIPWTGIKKAIANNMMNSLQTTAQCTATCEIDATKLLDFRKQFVKNADYIGTKITVNDLLCMAICKVQLKNPMMNGTFANDTFYMSKRVHLSVAVATESGLMVPVIKNADRHSLIELSEAIKGIAERAKERKLAPNEQGGATITISNVGMFPIDTSTPILNPPEVAIYGFGRTVKKVMVMEDGSFEARDMLTAYITFDHRVIDGLLIGRAFEDLKFLIENPELIVL